jgi:two-component system, OmpR family, sensor kinase
LTLRLRLVIGLVVLVLAGLALFGFATYSVYARSQYQRLDEQLASSVEFVSRELSPGLPGPGDGGGGGHERDHGGGPPPAGLSAATYAELRDRSNTIQSLLQPDASAKPRLPSVLQLDSADHPRHFTTGSALGSGTWRVYVASEQGRDSDLVVIAVPTGEVTTALHRLVLIETSGGMALLAILSIGAWLILRHGLRPLEQMATTAGKIASGDLSQRVTPSGGPSEVGQLGLALNTMLADIETSFAEREATELRLRQFLSDASHELRTPLTSIQGFAELFRIGPDAQEVDLPTIMRRIEQESARMKGLVEDLLLLARLDETRPIERQPVDLAVLAADACSDAVAVAPDHPITLDAPAPVVVLGDQAHLRQAIGNLVANAARHTPAGTRIDVSTTVDDGTAQVVVRDHGPGLEADAVAHAFDRFWQADQARAGAGAGLGLPIVAGIASEHGGSAVAGNAEDGGAVFILRLPQP